MSEIVSEIVSEWVGGGVSKRVSQTDRPGDERRDRKASAPDLCATERGGAHFAQQRRTKKDVENVFRVRRKLHVQIVVKRAQLRSATLNGINRHG